MNFSSMKYFTNFSRIFREFYERFVFFLCSYSAMYILHYRQSKTLPSQPWTVLKQLIAIILIIYIFIVFIQYLVFIYCAGSHQMEKGYLRACGLFGCRLTWVYPGIKAVKWLLLLLFIVFISLHQVTQPIEYTRIHTHTQKKGKQRTL